MAIWQYTFIVIPKEDLSKLKSGSRIDINDYNNFEFWKEANYKTSFFRPLTDILPRQISWHKDILLFGSEDSNCVKLIMESDQVVEVEIRLDFRSNYSLLLNNLIEFCLYNSLSLLDEELNEIPLNSITIKNTIENSPQYLKFKELSSPPG